MRRWRWVVVAAFTAVLAALPLTAQLLPAGGSKVTAVTLLRRIQASGAVAYSGYAQSTGGLSLPVDTGPFTVNDLLGGTTQARVWWRSAADWRVDTVAVTGETDLHHDRTGTWTWDYEANAAERTSPSGLTLVRLPRSDDLVPASLGRRLLSEVSAADVQRLGSVRVAGRSAAGLRLTVHDPRSTIRHVDVWALAASGLPLRVAVYGTSATPVISTTMLDLDVARPAPSTTAFTPPATADQRNGDVVDIVAALDQFGSSTPPDTLAGLPRRRGLNLGAVGVYGSGVTTLVAIPLPPRLGYSLQSQLQGLPGVHRDPGGGSPGDPAFIQAALALHIGPVSLQLSAAAGFGGRWLLVGTLTPKALHAAATALPPVSGFGFR